ncbi:MAG TPA: glycosyltransferase [Steroidobacteraceae bacterium]|nr:glycosyltransferase [Steroidobacteraceae bacterium]
MSTHATEASQTSYPAKYRFVCATRVSQQEFFATTALGRSLALFQAPFAELTLFDNNRMGLPALYNEAIRDSHSDPAILVFIHDDVHLCDLFWHVHILAGLRAFDVIGIAGNRRRLPRQPAWNFIDERFTWDTAEHLSGMVAHGTGFPPRAISGYGPPAERVKLLDGMLLAVHSKTLIASEIQFDERFSFHFYDMDFCRQAEARNLRMGTWTVSAIHESDGAFDSPAWRDGYAQYLDKWQS